jgi:hypothetical protein
MMRKFSTHHHFPESIPTAAVGQSIVRTHLLTPCGATDLNARAKMMMLVFLHRNAAQTRKPTPYTGMRTGLSGLQHMAGARPTKRKWSRGGVGIRVDQA